MSPNDQHPGMSSYVRPPTGTVAAATSTIASAATSTIASAAIPTSFDPTGTFYVESTSSYDDSAESPPTIGHVRPASTFINPASTIFVTNLPAGLTEEQVEGHLKDLYSAYTTVEPAVTVRRDRMSCLYAYVELNTVEETEKAIVELADEEMNGVHMRLERVHENSTLYLSRPGVVLTAAEVKELVEPYGAVTNVIIGKPVEQQHQQSNQSRSRGGSSAYPNNGQNAPAPATSADKTAAFVTYPDRVSAEEALERLLAGLHDWFVGWEVPTSDTPTPSTDVHTLFLGGLNRKSVTKELVRDRFKRYGNIVAVDLILNETDEKSRSAFAFVRYAEPYSAPIAIEHENGIEWLNKRIRAQFCEPPEVKQRRRTTPNVYPVVSHGALAAASIPAGWHQQQQQHHHHHHHQHSQQSRQDAPIPYIAVPNYYMMATTPDFSQPAMHQNPYIRSTPLRPNNSTSPTTNSPIQQAAMPPQGQVNYMPSHMMGHNPSAAAALGQYAWAPINNVMYGGGHQQFVLYPAAAIQYGIPTDNLVGTNDHRTITDGMGNMRIQ